MFKVACLYSYVQSILCICVYGLITGRSVSVKSLLYLKYLNVTTYKEVLDV